MARVPSLVLILALSAVPAAAHDAPAYRLPGDPDTMVRRGPEVTPEVAQVTPAPGNSAVRVEDLPLSPVRPVPETRLTVTREVFVPVRPVFYPDPRWRLRIRREDGEWSGDFVIGTPGLGWPHVRPREPARGAASWRLPGD